MAVLFFFCGGAIVAYTLFGYPLLLLLWGRLWPRPIRRGHFHPSVSIIIPVRNGEAWIVRKLQSVAALNYPSSLCELIVVSDGSTDRTAELVRQFPRVQFIELPPGGKALALNAGMARATGELLFFTDVRQALHPDCLTNLAACFADPTVGVVSGELVMTRAEGQEQARIGLYVRYEEWLRKQISAVGSVPGATGAVYAMRRSLAVSLPAGILLDDVYQPLAAYFQGYRVILDGRAIAYDVAVPLKHEFRRKVRTLAGIYQIIGHYPRLWNPAHDIWIHFLSHKVARLVLPYGFLLMAVSSLWLPDPYRLPILTLQGLFYGSALLDFGLPDAFPLKRLTSLNRMFITLLAASLAAASILFVPSRSLWAERR